MSQKCVHTPLLLFTLTFTYIHVLYTVQVLLFSRYTGAPTYL